MSIQRIVLTAGGQRDDPVLEVLGEFANGTLFSAVRAAAVALAAEFPGQVVAVEYDNQCKLVDNPPFWTRYLWIKPDGFTDTQATERVLAERKRQETEKRVERRKRGPRRKK